MRLQNYLIGILIICFMFTFSIDTFADISDGLVAYYPFNGNADDESGNGNNGTVNGAVLVEDRFGVVDRAYNFNGVDDYIEIVENSLIDFQNTDDFSISLWFKTTSSNASMCPLSKHPGYSSTGYQFVMNHKHSTDCSGAGMVSFYVAPDMNGGDSCSDKPLNDGAWHFIVGTYNSSNNLNVLYVDGVPQSDTGSASYNLDNSANLLIGDCTSELSFDGSIDDVRIYNRILSEDEILELCGNLNCGLVAYYPFNGNANDESGNENHGTENGDVTYVEGMFDQAASFDGVGDYIKANADPLPTAERTVSLWFKANTVDNHPGILGYGGATCGTSFLMMINHGWSGYENTYHSQGHCWTNQIDFYYPEPPVDAWYHWVITIDPTASQSMKMYVNCELVTENSNYTTNTYVSEKDIAFGVVVHNDGIAPYTGSEVGYFNGALDDIRIYNRVLSEDEIQELCGAVCGCEVNGDGTITPQDALCAFQKYLGICPTVCGTCEEVCCDVNQDDNCTPADALCIFQEYLGIVCEYCN